MSTVSVHTDTSIDAAPTDPGEMRPVRSMIRFDRRRYPVMNHPLIRGFGELGGVRESARGAQSRTAASDRSPHHGAQADLYSRPSGAAEQQAPERSVEDVAELGARFAPQTAGVASRVDEVRRRLEHVAHEVLGHIAVVLVANPREHRGAEEQRGPHRVDGVDPGQRHRPGVERGARMAGAAAPCFHHVTGSKKKASRISAEGSPTLTSTGLNESSGLSNSILVGLTGFEPATP
jgi:hypothetical protein